MQQKHREFAKSGGGTLLKQYPALAAAVEAGLQEPSKLGLAIELYQRQLQKLGVPPEKRGLLPGEALATLAEQYHAQAMPAAKVDWLRRLAEGAGEERAHAVMRALGKLPGGFDPAAERALHATLAPGGRRLAESIVAAADRREQAELENPAERNIQGDGGGDGLDQAADGPSEELDAAYHSSPTSDVFRAFAAKMEQAAASPQELAAFAAANELYPDRVQLMLDIAVVDSTTPEATVDALRRRIGAVIPDEHLSDQNFFSKALYDRSDQGDGSEASRLLAIYNMLPWARIRRSENADRYAGIDDQFKLRLDEPLARLALLGTIRLPRGGKPNPAKPGEAPKPAAPAPLKRIEPGAPVGPDDAIPVLYDDQRYPGLAMRYASGARIELRVPNLEKFRQGYVDWWYKSGGELYQQRLANPANFRMAPSESYIWQKMRFWKIVDGRFEVRWNQQAGDKARYFRWDRGGGGRHRPEIEVFDSDSKHMGSIDPLTGQWIKGAVKGREVSKEKVELQDFEPDQNRLA